MIWFSCNLSMLHLCLKHQTDHLKMNHLRYQALVRRWIQLNRHLQILHHQSSWEWSILDCPQLPYHKSELFLNLLLQNWTLLRAILHQMMELGILRFKNQLHADLETIIIELVSPQEVYLNLRFSHSLVLQIKLSWSTKTVKLQLSQHRPHLKNNQQHSGRRHGQIMNIII